MSRVALGSLLLAAAVVLTVAFVRWGSGEASLGVGPVTTEAAATVPTVSGPVDTIPLEGWLDVDAAQLFADPCALLTPELRAEVGVEATPAPDGDGRCVAGSGQRALEVDVVLVSVSPFVASSDFQVAHNQEPLPAERLGIGLQVRYGDRFLLAAFCPEVSITFTVPVDEVAPELIEVVRRALV